MKPSVTLLLLCLCTLTASAQQAYRCGNAYSDSPCPQARVVDVSDVRSDSQRTDARLLAANDKRLGDEMARERMARDAAEKRAAKPNRPKAVKRPRATKIKWFRP
jgi:hypothetical protein